MHIERYQAGLFDEWNAFVDTSKNGLFLFNRKYLEYHSDRFDDYSLVIRDDAGEILALLPAHAENGQIVSHNGLTFGGFVIDYTMKTPLMLDIFRHTLDYCHRQGFSDLIYRPVPHIYHSLPAEEDLYALFVCKAQILERRVTTVVGQNRLPFSQRRQRGLKKAQKHGLIPRQSDDFAGYWALLSDLLRAVHNTQPIHTFAEIDLLRIRLPEQIKLFACYEGETMIAGTVIYENRHAARTQYIAANERGKELGALDLLFYYLLNEVYPDIPFFEFGTSHTPEGDALNLGLITQKEEFGGRTVTCDTYIVPCAG